MLVLSGLEQVGTTATFWEGIAAYCELSKKNNNHPALNAALVNLRLACQEAVSSLMSKLNNVDMAAMAGTTPKDQKLLADWSLLLKKKGQTNAICSTVTKAAAGEAITELLEYMNLSTVSVAIASATDAASKPGGGSSAPGSEQPPSLYANTKTKLAGIFTVRNVGITMVAGSALAIGYQLWQKRKQRRGA